MNNHSFKLRQLLLSFSLAAVLAIVPPRIAAADSLRAVQDHILNTSNGLLLETKVELSGTIEKIEFVTGNHYNMFVSVDEEMAHNPIGTDKPFFIAHFRLHDVYMPFEPGQSVTIAGEINYLYSSPMVPYIVVSTINGSEDF